MRVVVQGDPTTRSAAEDTVIGLLREWTGDYHLPGLCLMHVHVPTGTRTREVDGILWTPHGLAVLEVKGFTSAQAGTLRIPANGPWQVDLDWPVRGVAEHGQWSGDLIQSVLAAPDELVPIQRSTSRAALASLMHRARPGPGHHGESDSVAG